MSSCASRGVGLRRRALAPITLDLGFRFADAVARARSPEARRSRSRVPRSADRWTRAAPARRGRGRGARRRGSRGRGRSSAGGALSPAPARAAGSRRGRPSARRSASRPERRAPCRRPRRRAAARLRPPRRAPGRRRPPRSRRRRHAARAAMIAMSSERKYIWSPVPASEPAQVGRPESSRSRANVTARADLTWRAGAVFRRRLRGLEGKAARSRGRADRGLRRLQSTSAKCGAVLDPRTVRLAAAADRAPSL